MFRTDDIGDRPLASGWEKLRAQFEERNTFNSIEMEMFRLVYMFGARRAVRNRHAIACMAAEIRTFEHEVMPARESIHADQQR